MYFKIITLFIFLIFNSSCLNQGKAPKIPGLIGPKLNINSGKIILSLVLEKIELQAGSTLPIPKLQNSNITLSPRLEGGSIFQINFDPKDIESDYFKVVPDSRLPDGREFPFLVGGTLPALAINIPKAYDSTFYASNKVFGLALPVNIPSEFDLSIHYRLKINDKNVGIVSLIGSNNVDEKSMVVVLLTLDSIVKNPEFKTFIKLSRKYPSYIF